MSCGYAPPPIKTFSSRTQGIWSSFPLSRPVSVPACFPDFPVPDMRTGVSVC